MDKLARLELGYLSDVESFWQSARELRNRLSRDYPDDPDEPASFSWRLLSPKTQNDFGFQAVHWTAIQKFRIFQGNGGKTDLSSEIRSGGSR